MTRERAGRALLFAVAALLVACAPRTVHLAWDVTFATPLLAARAVRVETSVHDGADCSGATRYAASVVRGDGAPEPPPLPSGTYTLCAAAIDDACNVFASGETTVDLRSASLRVAVLLSASAPEPACAGSSCAHGDCVGADAGATADGSSADAGDIDSASVDAGTDAGDTDAGCTSYVIASPTAPACQASTHACVDTCADQACFDGCVAADPSPTTCRVCLDDAYDACANAVACQSAWDTLVCCSNACPVPSAPSCCPGEYSSWIGCIDGQGTACAMSENVCWFG